MTHLHAEMYFLEWEGLGVTVEGILHVFGNRKKSRIAEKRAQKYKGRKRENDSSEKTRHLFQMNIGHFLLVCL